MPLNINWQQILLHLLNLVILAVGLYLILYKPVKKFMQKREDAYKEREEKTQAALDDAQAKQEEYSLRLAKVDEESAQKREEAAREMAAVREQKLAEAGKQADDIVDAARERAKKEHDRIINGVSEDIKSIVEEMTEKVVMTSSVSEAYDRFLDEAEKGSRSAHTGGKKKVTSMSKSTGKGARKRQ